MSTYFYACSYLLEPGSIVGPGNWGRILQAYNHGFGNPWTLIREEVFEKARTIKYPEKPSRFKSIFLCESRESLSDFLNSSHRHLDILYEVEIVDRNSSIHHGCLGKLDFTDRDSFTEFEKRADEYWEALNIQRPEVMVESPIKIVARA